MGSATSPIAGLPSPLRLRPRIYLRSSTPYRLGTTASPRFAGLPFCVPPSLHPGGTGILTCCPSPTPLGLGLGPTNPTRTDLPSETLDVRRIWFSHISRYSCQHSHFCTLHCSSRYSFYAVQNAPLPVPLLWNSVASVSGLSPVTFSAQERLTSELLRTL